MTDASNENWIVDPAGGMELGPKSDERIMRSTGLANADSWAEQANRDFMERRESAALVATIHAVRELIRYLKEEQ